MFYTIFCRRLSLGLFAVCLIITLGVKAPAAFADEEKPNLRAGSWAGYRYVESGDVVSCSLFSVNNSGLAIGVVRYDESYQYLAFIHPDWVLKKGETYDVEVGFDSSRALRLKAVVLSESIVGVAMQPGSDLERSFRTLNALQLRAAKENFSFRLKGSAAALDTVAGCFRTAGRSSNPESRGNPFSNQGDKQPRGASPADEPDKSPKKGLRKDYEPPAEKTAPTFPPGGDEVKYDENKTAPPPALTRQQEAQKVTEQLTLGSQLNDVTITTTSGATASRWQSRELDGSLIILQFANQGPTPNEAAIAHTALNTLACTGTVENKTSPISTPQGELLKVTSRCPQGEANASPSLLAYIAKRPAGGVYIYQMEVKDKKADTDNDDDEPIPGLFTALAVASRVVQ